MQEVERYADERTPFWIIATASAVGAVVVAGLFWIVWKSQFAAPPGYLFGTPTQPIEAGYCLAVAQSIYPGGAPSGGFFAEAADFWVHRLRYYGGDLAGAIAAGQAALSRDLSAAQGQDAAWLNSAMEACANRALNYGAHFKSFD